MYSYKYYLRDSSKKMTKSLALDIVKRNVVTERSAKVAQQKYITIIVGSQYNKCDIKKACELLYEQEIVSVNVLNKKQRKRMFKGKAYIRSDVKKAMIRFKNESVINQVFGGEQ